ncbi:hypothetical protein L6164_020176 [Bauhinia variegata]|uniref:Uncharacterized protein n=1 Tax=Bauhinia variegata TaxID=167791 RepID=A0ACB9MV13_BAUVA|nr:hypothetical protein L6164_020176 [Bauhinia variegata]
MTSLLQDNPLLLDNNVEERVNDFVSAALSQASVTRGNHIMWTMGDDFQYQYAETWFRQMDKFIPHVNKATGAYIFRPYGSPTVSRPVLPKVIRAPNVALVTLEIKELKEVSLSANQEKSEMKK